MPIKAEVALDTISEEPLAQALRIGLASNFVFTSRRLILLSGPVIELCLHVVFVRMLQIMLPFV